MNMRDYKKWVGRSFWSLLDQGLFAVSNFILNVLLARWLLEAEYGAFSVAFAVFLFLGVIYSSLMVEPMLVMGPGRYDGSFFGYLGVLRQLHWRYVGGGITLLGLLLSLFYLRGGIFASLAALSLCSSVIFYQWLLRRACYIRMEPKVAAVGGLVYLLVMVSGASVLRVLECLTPVTGVLMLAAASAPASAWIIWRLSRTGTEQVRDLSLREVMEAHWNYGRWSVATSALGWFPGNIYFLLLPWWHGSEATGAFRAGFNIGLPMFQVLATAAMLLLPTLVRARAKPGYLASVYRLSFMLGVCSALYVVLVWLAGEKMFGLLYGGRFVGQAHHVWLIVLPVVPAAVVAVLSCGVRALEAPEKVFVAYVAASIVCLAVGLPLTYFRGVSGAAIGLTASSCTCAITLWIQLRGVAATGRLMEPSVPEPLCHPES